MSIFTSFNFKWPSSLVKLFDVASAATYNDQLMAPECSVSLWNFSLKYVPYSCAEQLCFVAVTLRIPCFPSIDLSLVLLLLLVTSRLAVGHACVRVVLPG